MKPITMAIVTIVVLFVIGGSIYLGVSHQDVDSTTLSPVGENTTIQNEVPATTSAKMDPSATNEFSGKLSDLFARADSQVCEMKPAAAGQMSGTFYVASGRVRGDAKFAENDMSINLIIKDKTMYFWTTNPTPYGFKVGLTELQTNAPSPAAGSGAANQYQDVLTKSQTFTCNAWPLDESKFTLPADITFNVMPK